MVVFYLNERIGLLADQGNGTFQGMVTDPGMLSNFPVISTFPVLPMAKIKIQGV